MTAVALLWFGIYYDLHIENREEISVKTFLQRKILRTKKQADLQKNHSKQLDRLIESHYEAIKRLKREQVRDEEIAVSLYASVGYLINRLSPKEKYTLFEGEK